MRKALTLFHGEALERPVWRQEWSQRAPPVRAGIVVVHTLKMAEFWIAPQRQLRIVTSWAVRSSLLVMIPIAVVVLPTVLLLKVAVGIVAAIVATVLVIVNTTIMILLGLIVIWLLLEILAYLFKFSAATHGRRR